ncbi:LysM peptidoglycan-binding domain-containing protein [Ornithinimicrobium sp. INDO-MA30-4]|uniref:LysM peptidoglycan-binding domain-containing protein n=1 Tax=Ornithinimicrobium sp. INDO-MA30-4 TaxID=2908651 RepID=UPI001F44B463|nr:LysM peptidoglycan-binding domain-containing protein [Ornithinimicrobium sp. INDO-MA30-4]UJH71767.1 LysM peptidoglycan-binding domain-containing protein [Ornithinimicrobium sp. INDO-MA30-4]
MGALAALGLLAVLVGTPVLLLALGANPFPASVPSLDEARAALLSPDDGTLVLGVLKLVAWIAWIALAVIIVVEIAAQIRGMRAPTLPGLSFPQSAVRPLVSTALALFILAPATAPTSMATDAPAAAPASASVQQLSPQAVSEVTATEALTSETEQQAAPTQAYTVQTGDSLWSIAEQHLGEGKEYPRIAELNEDVLSGEGIGYFPAWNCDCPRMPLRPNQSLQHRASSLKKGTR